MKVWVLYEVHSDNATYSHAQLYSIHETEEGAYVAAIALENINKQDYCQRDIEIRETEVLT